MEFPEELDKLKTVDPDLDKLEDLFKKTSHDDILNHCVDSLKSSDGPAILRLCLLGSSSLDSLRQRLLRRLLVLLMSEDCLASTSDVTGQVLLHLQCEPRLSTRILEQLCSVCIEELRENQSKLNPRWLPILAKLLTLLADRDDLENPGFRVTSIRSICMGKWHPKNAPELIAAFRDVVMTPEEVEILIEKVCSVTSKMDATEVPPMVYQTLLLTSSYGNVSARVLKCLADYFNKNNNQESSRDDQVGSDLEPMRRAESIVLFHMAYAIRRGHPVSKEIMKMLKSGQAVPENVLNPFCLLVSLAMTCVKQHRPGVVDALKVVATKCVHLQHKRSDNLWFRKQTAQLPDIAKLLEVEVIEKTTRYSSWELIGEGVVDLALALLDASSGLAKPDSRLRQLWALGTSVLTAAAKNHSSTVPVIIKHLTKRIMFSRAATKYTDALTASTKQAMALIREQASILNEVLEHVGNLSLGGGKRVLQALMPVVTVSRPLRDMTILVVRKALFSPKVETRGVAITGVLLMLKNFRISSAMLSNSQLLLSQSSSGLSQIAVDVNRGKSASNENLCFELLGVLKRGFTQQAQVRMALYRGLYDVVVRNPELCPAVLLMLYQHAVAGKLNNVNALSPVDIEEVVVEDDGEPLVVEPVGWFLHCVQLLVGKAQQIYGDRDEEDLVSLEKLVDLLEDLSKKYSTVDLTDMNFEKNADYSRTTGQTNALRVDSMKNVLEALMEYVITHGIDVDDDKARLLLALFTRHTEISELLKASGVTTRGGAKKKKDELASQTVLKAGPSKVKATKSSFMLPEHAFSLKALSVVLKTMLIDNVPSHQTAVSIIRGSRNLQVYFLKVTMEKLKQLDKSLSLGGLEGHDIVFGHLSNIANVLFQHCLTNKEADQSLLLFGLECLMACLSLVTTHFVPKSGQFYQAASCTKGSKSSDCLVAEWADQTMAKITVVQDSLDDSNDEEELLKFKTIGGYFRLLKFLLQQLDCDNSEPLVKIYDWAKRYCEKTCGTSVDMLKPAFDLLLAANERVKAHPTVHKDIAMKIRAEMGNIDSSTVADESDSLYGFVTGETGEAVFNLMLPYLESIMDSVDVVIYRCRQTGQQDHTMFEAQKDLEAVVCHALGRIINAAGPLAQTRFSSLEHVVKLLLRFYTSIDLLAKHFFVRCKSFKDAVRTSHFDQLVNRVGQELTPKVYELITYISNNTENSEGSGKRKKKDKESAAIRAKVVRETKSIPTLIFKVEAFEKDLIRLSSKCQVNLLQNIKLSTARDFRFDLDQLEANENEENEETENSIDSRDHAAESTRLGSQTVVCSQTILQSQNSMIQSGILREEESQESQPPPTKRLKVKIGGKKRSN